MPVAEDVSVGPRYEGVLAFAGRVLASFLALVVLFALAAVLVLLAYFSKFRSEASPHPPPAAGRAAPPYRQAPP